MLRLYKGAIKPKQDFLIAHCSLAGARSVELLAQQRNNGRVLDAARMVLGGSEIIQVDVDLFEVVAAPALKGWRLRYQVWPRDINIRLNMATSAWRDLEAIIAGRDAEIVGADGAFIPQNEFLALLSESEGPCSAALRWQVISGDDGGIYLQLQSLPGSAPVLNGKPALRK
jgi:hypothetical protein